MPPSLASTIRRSEQIGKYFSDYAKTKMGGSAKVGIVGALNSFIQNQRLDGFKAAAQAGSGVSSSTRWMAKIFRTWR